MNDINESVCQEKVFERLFRTHARNLRNFLYYKSGNERLAEDCMQEAFLKMWRECERVPVEKARSFLFTVAQNLFLDHARHEQVVLRFASQNPPAEHHTETPHSQMERSELQNELEKAISALPENQRMVFLMNRLDGKTYAEIAEILDLSVKAVEKRMTGALKTLRDTVKNL